MLKTVVAAAVVASFVLAVGAMPSETRATDASVKIGGRVLRDTAGGATAPIVVYLRDQADLSRAYAHARPGRARLVRLQDAQGARRADAGSAPRAGCRSRHAPYRSFWAANMIVSRGDRALVRQARRAPRRPRDRVGRRLGGLQVEPLPLRTRSPRSWRADAAARTAAIEWGVNDGPRSGALVARIHRAGHGRRERGHRRALDARRDQEPLPRLERQRGRPQLQLARRDPLGRRRLRREHVQPCDDSAHGTHTTGTVVGDDGAGNQIGVAPGAKWIGCRNMDQGTGSPATYTECFQFFIAPTDLGGGNADPDEAPRRRDRQLDVPAERGLRREHAADDRREHRGRRASSSRRAPATPGRAAARSSDPPAIYSSAFSTGAVDSCEQPRGVQQPRPGDVGRLEPDEAGRRRARRRTSARPSTRATPPTRTSAAPRWRARTSSGVVALLWSARPDLVRNIAATKQVLTGAGEPSRSGTEAPAAEAAARCRTTTSAGGSSTRPPRTAARTTC